MCSYGLVESRDGRRHTARRVERVDYRESNFAVLDSDDDEENVLEDLSATDSDAGDINETSSEEWKPRGDAVDDDDDADAEGATGRVEIVDGKPVCK